MKKAKTLVEFDCQQHPADNMQVIRNSYGVTFVAANEDDDWGGFVETSVTLNRKQILKLINKLVSSFMNEGSEKP